jgi:hypothetical protein
VLEAEVNQILTKLGVAELHEQIFDGGLGTDLARVL